MKLDNMNLSMTNQSENSQKMNGKNFTPTSQNQKVLTNYPLRRIESLQSEGPLHHENKVIKQQRIAKNSADSLIQNAIKNEICLNKTKSDQKFPQSNKNAFMNNQITARSTIKNKTSRDPSIGMVTPVKKQSIKDCNNMASYRQMLIIESRKNMNHKNDQLALDIIKSSCGISESLQINNDPLFSVLHNSNKKVLAQDSHTKINWNNRLPNLKMKTERKNSKILVSRLSEKRIGPTTQRNFEQSSNVEAQAAMEPPKKFLTHMNYMNKSIGKTNFLDDNRSSINKLTTNQAKMYKTSSIAFGQKQQQSANTEEPVKEDFTNDKNGLANSQKVNNKIEEKTCTGSFIKNIKQNSKTDLKQFQYQKETLRNTVESKKKSDQAKDRTKNNQAQTNNTKSPNKLKTKDIEDNGLYTVASQTKPLACFKLKRSSINSIAKSIKNRGNVNFYTNEELNFALKNINNEFRKTQQWDDNGIRIKAKGGTQIGHLSKRNSKETIIVNELGRTSTKCVEKQKKICVEYDSLGNNIVGSNLKKYYRSRYGMPYNQPNENYHDGNPEKIVPKRPEIEKPDENYHDHNPEKIVSRRQKIEKPDENYHDNNPEKIVSRRHEIEKTDENYQLFSRKKRAQKQCLVQQTPQRQVTNGKWRIDLGNIDIEGYKIKNSYCMKRGTKNFENVSHNVSAMNGIDCNTNNNNKNDLNLSYKQNKLESWNFSNKSEDSFDSCNFIEKNTI